MNPTQGQASQQQVPQQGASSQQGGQQTDPNRVKNIYEQLRQVLTQAVQEGIPGMDQVLNVLNQQFTKIANPNDKLGGQPATPQNPTPQGSYSPFG